jgi:fucose permease
MPGIDAITHATQPSIQPIPGPTRDLVVASFAAFFLIGWTGLLVPSLIRQVQAQYGQTDGGMGLAYLLTSVLYVGGTMAVGILARRVARPRVLGAGPGLMATGLVVAAVAPAWPVFLLGYAFAGLGSGIVDAGVNALVMDLYPGRAAMLNRLHLFFALGALAAPLAVGLAVGAGVPWTGLLLVTAAMALPVGIVLGTRSMPPSHAVPVDPVAPAARATPVTGRGHVRLGRAPLVLLAIAIACYVATELGVSSWLVRYLEPAPLAVATLALSLFWAALGLGRLVSSFVVDRMSAVRFATLWATGCGIAILAAILVPWLPATIALFAVAGFAAGPVYPMIMAIGGSLYPGRASTVSSTLASAAIAGSIVVPPLMGVVSEVAGLWWSMLGAGLFVIGGAVAIRAAAAVADRARRVPAT